MSRSWTLERRLSDFARLNTLISSSAAGQIELPLFPLEECGSYSEGVSAEDKVAADVAVGEKLEKFIRGLILLPEVWNQGDLVRFLDNEEHTMLFMWNMEKMQKAQDVSVCQSRQELL